MYSRYMAHIRKEPSELEGVLSEIKQLKDSETETKPVHHPPHLNPESKRGSSRQSMKIVLFV